MGLAEWWVERWICRAGAVLPLLMSAGMDGKDCCVTPLDHIRRKKRGLVDRLHKGTTLQQPQVCSWTASGVLGHTYTPLLMQRYDGGSWRLNLSCDVIPSINAAQPGAQPSLAGVL